MLYTPGAVLAAAVEDALANAATLDRCSLLPHLVLELTLPAGAGAAAAWDARRLVTANGCTVLGSHGNPWTGQTLYVGATAATWASFAAWLRAHPHPRQVAAVAVARGRLSDAAAGDGAWQAVLHPVPRRGLPVAVGAEHLAAFEAAVTAAGGVVRPRVRTVGTLTRVTVELPAGGQERLATFNGLRELAAV